MADQDVKNPAQELPVVGGASAATEKAVEEPIPVPEPESETEQREKELPEAEGADAAERQVTDSGDAKVDGQTQSVSFKEETTQISDLPDAHKKALLELKQLVQEALNGHEFSAPTPPSNAEAEEEKKEADISAAIKTEEEEKEMEKEEEEKDKEEERAKSEPKVDESKAKEPRAEFLDEDAKKETEKKEEESEVVEKATTDAAPAGGGADAGDDDGAKTVEAIEETIVAVSSASTVQTEPEPSGVATKENKTETRQSQPEEVSIWGIPLLADERSDVVLLKFLRARDFKVKDAFAMLKNTIKWRKGFGIDQLVEQDLGLDDLEKVVFMHGFDREGHPVCYNVYGEFQNKELYQKTFSDAEKRQNFLRWRIQFLERSIRKLDFTPGGISTMVQINDLKNSPGPGKWELRQATKQALHLLQDNYPEFLAKQAFINVPWWYLAVNRMISPFLTQRTRSKFVFAGPSKSAETLFRYIAAEQVPVKYGGLSKDGDEFDTSDAVTEVTVRPAAKHTVEFSVTEKCSLTWEVRVVGWEVSYSAEFVPSAQESYTVIIQKKRTVSSGEDPVFCSSFKSGEAGKVVLTIDNTSSKKKKLLYRLKRVPTQV